MTVADGKGVLGLEVPHIIHSMPARAPDKDTLVCMCDGTCDFTGPKTKEENKEDNSDKNFKLAMEQLEEDAGLNHVGSTATQQMWTFARPEHFYDICFTGVQS